MKNNFIWKWENTPVSGKHLAIYKDEQLFGTIPNFDFTGIANINGHYFSVETTGSFLKQQTFICDPKNKINLGQVILYSNRSYHLEVNNKYKYKLTNGFYHNDEKCFIEIKNDKSFFISKSGTIEVLSDQDIELLIYCGFYANSLRGSE